VREKQEITVLNFAPGTGIAVAKLHEKNWAIMLGAPAGGANFANFLIDLDKRAWAQQRVQGVITQADVAVQTVTQIEVLNERDRHFAPYFDHAIQQVSVVNIEGTIEADRERNCSL
jgi:hypothetical protein